MNATNAFIDRYIGNHNMKFYEFAEKVNTTRQTLYNMINERPCSDKVLQDVINLVCLTKEEELLVWLEHGKMHPEMIDKLKYHSAKFMAFLTSL